MNETTVEKSHFILRFDIEVMREMQCGILYNIGT